MLNENHNNWKSKLEGLEYLPGENLQDKNVSWEKLYARLGGKKHNRKSLWYWTAAACLLFALMIPVMIMNKKNRQFAHIEIKQKQPGVITSVAPTLDKMDSIKNTDPVLSEKNEIIFEARFNKRENRIIPQKQINKIRLINTAGTQNLITRIANNSLQSVDTSSYLTALTPVKKKLKVVQINELGDPVETFPDIVRKTDKHLFEFKIAAQGIYINPAIASNTSGFTILKIRSSQN